MGQLEDIQVFIRVVEAGGIGKAAEQLNLAKSAVSRRLSDLEARLETKLLNRTTRKSSLTEAGRLYYEKSLELVEAVAEMDCQVVNENAQLEGSLKLAAPLSFGLEHLSPLLDQFATEHPKLTLNIDFSDRHVDLVEEGYDLAIRITDLKDSSLQARRLVPIRSVVCASPEYLAKNGTPETVEELKHHKTLLYVSDGVMNWPFIDQAGKEVRIHLQSQIYSNNGDYLLNMAKAGHGIVMQPTFIAWKALALGEVVPILTDYKMPSFYAYAVYPQNRYLSHKARVFIDFLVERFGDNAYWDQSASVSSAT